MFYHHSIGHKRTFYRTKKEKRPKASSRFIWLIAVNLLYHTNTVSDTDVGDIYVLNIELPFSSSHEKGITKKPPFLVDFCGFGLFHYITKNSAYTALSFGKTTIINRKGATPQTWNPCDNPILAYKVISVKPVENSP